MLKRNRGRPRIMHQAKQTHVKLDTYCHEAVHVAIESLPYRIPLSTFLRGIIRKWVEEKCRELPEELYLEVQNVARLGLKEVSPEATKEDTASRAERLAMAFKKLGENSPLAADGDTREEVSDG